MTPRQKAAELVDKFCTYQPMNEDVTFVYDGFKASKQCALIAVYEIINANPHSNPFNTNVYSTMSYWNEVKQEIEML
jgi:hypothetical protein